MCVCVCVQTVLAEQPLHPGGADTLPSQRVTRASILTTAEAVTGLPIGPLWTSWRRGRERALAPEQSQYKSMNQTFGTCTKTYSSTAAKGRVIVQKSVNVSTFHPVVPRDLCPSDTFNPSALVGNSNMNQLAVLKRVTHYQVSNFHVPLSSQQFYDTPWGDHM